MFFQFLHFKVLYLLITLTPFILNVDTILQASAGAMIQYNSLDATASFPAVSVTAPQGQSSARRPKSVPAKAFAEREVRISFIYIGRKLNRN